MQPIYLDHASTTACDPRVLEVMRPFFIEKSGNASSPHNPGRQARRAIEESRETAAAFLGALPGEIVFTSGASESNNQAIFSTARALKHKGRHMIASAIEHHSVLEPLHRLQEDGFQVTYIKPKPDGICDLGDIQSAVRPDTILVCLIHANNEIGTLQPVEEVGRLCRERGIYFLVDATQTVGHIPVHVGKLSCDMLSLSAHKFYGPQGAGALYLRQGIESHPYILGGDQERGRRAGTQNTPGIMGLAEALRICGRQMAESSRREMQLRDEIIDTTLREIPSAVLNGHRHKRLPNNAHFSFAGINGEELVSALDMAGIAASMGSACTWGRLEPSHVLRAMGVSDAMALGSLRVSIGRGTNEVDIGYFLQQLTTKVGRLCKSASSNS